MIKTKPSTPAYRDGWDRAFGEKQDDFGHEYWFDECVCPYCGHHIQEGNMPGRIFASPIEKREEFLGITCPQCSNKLDMRVAAETETHYYYTARKHQGDSH